jgi:hypothetical protein
MAVDLYLTDTGDLALSNNGDLAITPSNEERVRQQVQMRLATDMGDFVPYPNLGASLQRIVGKPNTERTGKFGVDLINRTLSYDAFLGRAAFKVEATPTSADVIQFDVVIPLGARGSVMVSLSQMLTL